MHAGWKIDPFLEQRGNRPLCSYLVLAQRRWCQAWCLHTLALNAFDLILTLHAKKAWPQWLHKHSLIDFFLFFALHVSLHVTLTRLTPILCLVVLTSISSITAHLPESPLFRTSSDIIVWFRAECRVTHSPTEASLGQQSWGFCVSIVLALLNYSYTQRSLIKGFVCKWTVLKYN